MKMNRLLGWALWLIFLAAISLAGVGMAPLAGLEAIAQPFEFLKPSPEVERGGSSLTGDESRIVLAVNLSPDTPFIWIVTKKPLPLWYRTFTKDFVQLSQHYSRAKKLEANTPNDRWREGYRARTFPNLS